MSKFYNLGTLVSLDIGGKNMYPFPLKITKKADHQQDQLFLLSIFLNHSGIDHWHLRSDICKLTCSLLSLCY